MDKLVNVKKTLRRMCPRCHSHNTKLCYIRNSSQRYTCKHCRRCWTHGWASRNIPIGARGRKIKHPKIDRLSVSQVNSLENHFSSLSVVLALPTQSTPSMDRMEVSDGSFYQGFHDVGSSSANQEEPNNRNQKINNTMNKNYNASTSGSGEYPGTDHMIKNNNNNV